MTSYYFWLVLFGFAGYLIITDESIAAAFYYVMKLIRFQYEKQKWWFLHNPRNPIVKYLMWRRSMKMAEEMMKELEKHNK